MTYLDELPHCPHCNRILRTRNDQPWCIDCQKPIHNPVVPRPTT
jgi:hypothetical protein